MISAGLPDVNYLLARVKWLLGQTEIAERLVEELARGTDATAEVFLLKAQVGGKEEDRGEKGRNYRSK